MKDWHKLLADETKILTKHFTSGRAGNRINKVIIHYNLGPLTIGGIHSVWQSRPASAHYQVDPSGRIGQLVWDANTAWHAGNSSANRTSIGIEHANGTRTDLEGPLTAKTLEEGAHLTAAVCKFYGLGRPVWLRNVFPHHHFSSTSCPGPLKKGQSQHAKYMERAGFWYDQMTGKAPAPKPAPKPQPTPVDDGRPTAVVERRWSAS